MDPVTTAVIGWAIGQAGTAGQRIAGRVLFGDKQQNALTKIVQEAIDSATSQVIPTNEQEIVREALQRESPDSSELRGADVIDLKEALKVQLLPTLSILAEQSYQVDANRFIDILVPLIIRGIQIDAARGGPLKSAAELLRFQLIASIGDEALMQLVKLNQRPTAFGDLRDSVIDIAALFDQLGLIEPGLNGEVYDTYRSPFVGREWLFEQVDSFVAANDRGYLLIEGEAGVGKSAFALWLAASRNYPSHFTRSPEGKETAIAIKNLGAQLIIKTGLDDLAPGGALPAAASQSSWLEHVIQVAAARHKETHRRRPLVLVVDGLDEAEPTNGTPLGLPASLPNGVFIIATMRVGTPLRWIRGNKSTFRIRSDDSANLEDMRQYLYQAAIEPHIGTMLSDAGFEIASFVDTIMERCAGVWIYLYYVLEEMRSGNRSPSSLDELPTGLWDYYTENVDSLRSDPARWDNFFLPILGLLAAAQEPITPSTLAALANISASAGEIARFITNEWRSFCAKSPGDRYSLFHQSLRDFLSGTPSLGSEGLPEFASTDRSELEAATIEAHRKIANRYLMSWGDFDNGLQNLATHPRDANIDDGYGLRHLPTHLEARDDREGIDRLLTCEQPDGSGAGINNVWYWAHDRTGSPDTYLAHLARASALAKHATEKYRTAGLSAPSIAWEIRYALIASRISGIAANLPPELIAALLEKGVWQPAQALTHIRNNPRADIRVRAYSLAVPFLPEVYWADFLIGALESCAAIRGEHFRSDYFTAIVSLLSRYGRPDITSAALAGALDLHSRRARAKVLAALAPHLAEPERSAALAQAVSTAQTIDDAPAQVEALAALAPHLAEPERSAALAQAVSTAQTIDDAPAQVEALAALAPHLAGQLLAGAFEDAQSIQSDWARAQVLAALVPCTFGDLRTAAITTSITAVSAISSESAQANVLAILAPFLDPRQLDDSLKFANRIQDRPARVRLQAALAPYVSAEISTALLTDALGTTRTITGEPARAEALSELTPHLNHSQLADALKLAQVISYQPSRLRALAALAPRLSPSLLIDALRSAQAMGGKNLDIEVLAAFAPYVPDDHRNEIVVASLDALRAMEGKPAYSETLASLAPNLSENDRSTLIAAALTSIHAIRIEKIRIDALTALARVLPPALSSSAIAVAKKIDNAPGQAEVLAALAPNLDPLFINEAFEIAKRVHFQPARASAVAALASRLDPIQVEEALQIARETRDRSAQAQILISLAPKLSSTLLDDALAIARRITYQPAKARALTALSQHLTEPTRSSVLSSAVDAALNINLPRPRAQALVLLAPLFEESRRSTLLDSALQASYAIEELAVRVDVLASLIPQLPIDSQPTAIAAAVEASASIRGPALIRSLSAVSPFLSPAMLAGMIDKAKDIRSESIRARALAAIAPYLQILDPKLFPDIEREIQVVGLIKDLTHSNAMLVLKAAVAQVASLGGQEAATECSTAVIDIERWWP